MLDYNFNLINKKPASDNLQIQPKPIKPLSTNETKMVEKKPSINENPNNDKGAYPPLSTIKK